VTSTPYHPKTNGLAERAARTLEDRMLAANDTIPYLNLRLQKCLMSYRNTPQKSTGRPPAELLFGRWLHTALLDSFCDNVALSPVIRHHCYDVDYTNNLSMTRFTTLDHFIISGTLFDRCALCVNVLHDVDNTSDHDPLILQLSLTWNVRSGFSRHASRGPRRLMATAKRIAMSSRYIYMI
jgi:hypothetical protein